jgi:predicted metal-dependent phosphoesterase TrpH
MSVPNTPTLQHSTTTSVRSADLHLHSRYSDGRGTPAELARQAAQAGYAAIAITDHDTVDGIPVALQQHDVEILPGVEITCRLDRQEVHLLGYLPGHAWQETNLQRVLAHAKEVRAQRIGAIVAELNRLGIELSAAEVETCSECGVMGRPHVALALQKRGVVATTEEAFERFLKRGRPAYVERYRMTMAEGIGLIRRAGGVPVLAHPGLQSVDDRLRELVAQGIAGIEVQHPQHTPAQTTRYQRFANEFHLIATGGSDAHGDLPGTIRVPYEVVEQLRQYPA